MVASRIHLVRHGEVHNPHGVLYGRIPGYGLSDLGHRMADAAARALEESGAPVNRVIASPLQRAQESAAPWVERFALEVATDERVIEPTNRFEGSRFPSPARIARSPRLWPLVVDPVRPSWGESYRSIAARMAEAVKAAHRSVPDGDVVIVSHQLPIWMVHLSLAGERLFHDPRKRRCALSSITTVERVGDRFVETGYIDAAAGLTELAVDEGAV
ncbi:histidine phosphatase family protein [Clavibacter zhangzhiyongii]|uniref:histidine phosphatase family protein n=1 Tax=Clavibacter zhangzhiyongii TaxID=2768071 RepID=UPI0039E139EC